ncbi:MAG: lysophospholipid acyltransferase family protein [Pseudomonadota bacterium]|nr:lysophospholipid acyltransferase family protein [Pseudomonadota bacterium]
MKIIRFAMFVIFGWASLIFFTPIVIVSSIFGHRVAFRVVKFWALLVLLLIKYFCGLTFRVKGKENISDKACIIYMKHSSAYETLVQLVLFPMQCWVLKRELMWLPFFGWAAAALKPIAINRKGGRIAVNQIINQGIRRLSKGISIIIFPEGTRMPFNKTKRYGISGALLAQKARVKILPIAHNAGAYWPKQRNWITPGVVTFIIGKPVVAEGRDAQELNLEIQTWIQDKIIKTEESKI